MQIFTRSSRFSLVMFFSIALSTYAQGTKLKVSCGQKGQSEAGFPSINAALKRLNPEGPNTLTVSGTCRESVMIQSFDRLTLTGQPGASIVDTTNGTGVVLDILDSHRVSVSGFTIVGGLYGIACESFSTCYFVGNTVRDSVNAGVIVAQSNAALDSGSIENNFGSGLISLNGSNVALSAVALAGNGSGGGAAADARNHSLLQIVNSDIHDNADSGAEAIDDSSLVLIGTTITRNAGDGAHVERASTVKFVSGGNSTVMDNAGSGVFLRDLSYGFFGAEGATVTANNSGLDVNCSPQFPATRGALSHIGGGTTNCVEP